MENENEVRARDRPVLFLFRWFGFDILLDQVSLYLKMYPLFVSLLMDIAAKVDTL